METKIVHCQKANFTKYIGRPKKGQPWGFGNPFVIGKDGDRETVIQKFSLWLELGEKHDNSDATDERRRWILDNLDSLDGETLGCWCDYPKEDCHGSVLIEELEDRKMAFKIPGKFWTLAIIGTAGRGEDYRKLNAEIYERMIDAAKKVIEVERITHLVSGGAAWSDNTLCELDLPRKIYLPDDPKCVSTAEYYQKRFREKVPNAATYDGAEIIHGGNFHSRNLLVARDAQIFLAMTFGNKSEVKDGGTRHTVDAMLKSGKRGYHLDLNDLRLYNNAK